MPDLFPPKNKSNKFAFSNEQVEQLPTKPVESSTYLTREEAAKYLKLDVDTLSRYAANSLIPSLRIGCRFIFTEAQLKAIDIKAIKFKHLKTAAKLVLTHPALKSPSNS